MPSIVIDCRFASIHAGLGRYTRELVSALLQRSDPLSYTLLVRDPAETWIPAGTRAIAAPYPHYSLAEQTKLPRLLRSLDADLLFSPHFNIPIACPLPFVATIHDLILHRYPNTQSPLKQLAYRFLFRRTVYRARHLITVSNFVGDDLARTYGKNVLDRVSVIHEGVHERFSPRPESEQRSLRERFGIDRPFFLYIGNAKQHKNVPLLLEAFQRAATDRELILVTSGPEAEALTLPAGARFLPDVHDDDLPALYSAATALVTASLYEGFGLPVAEAQACGCPVIATRGSAIKEVAREGALLLPPIIEAFAAALRSPPQRTSPVRHWRWEDTAKRTADVLRSALGQ